MYFNLYKGKALFFSGCGMPEAEYLWSDEENCPHTEETRRAYGVLRESFVTFLYISPVYYAYIRTQPVMHTQPVYYAYGIEFIIRTQQ